MKLSDRELVLILEALTGMVNSPEVSMYRKQDHRDCKKLVDKITDEKWSQRSKGVEVPF